MKSKSKYVFLIERTKKNCHLHDSSFSNVYRINRKTSGIW
jgi:hypothetical protein